jgi:glycosyltransferase involved in cell wall biosynthesis
MCELAPLGQKQYPRVTIVMAVYNAGQFLHQAVASVLAQTYENFELVVVDDCSTDNSLAVLRSFQDQRIQIIRRHTNMGAALSRNNALAVARGELIAIMDADDVCSPNRLERQVAFLDEHPEIGLIGSGAYENIDTDGKALCTTVLPIDNGMIQKMLLEKWCFLHSSIMFRKSLHSTAGGYRQSFEPIEDHDFVLRLLELSEGANPHERLVDYRLNPQGLSAAGHSYIGELRTLAVQLAKRRRSGQPEDLDGELQRISAMKRKRNARGPMSKVVRFWSDSVYVARRYNEFGCSAFCEGEFEKARRCFARSIKMNAVFVKSWFGLAVSQIPNVASHLRFMFLPSERNRSEIGHIRWSVKTNVDARR